MKEKLHIRHIEFYIVILILSVIIAAVSFTYACSNMNRNDPGFYDISAQVKEKIPGYSKGYTFSYYLDGNSGNIGEIKSRLSDLYSERLSSLVARLDENNTYEGYTSIHELNIHPNEEVTLEEMNYNILKDAYDKTKSFSNYSIFAEPLYTFWSGASGIEDENERKAYDPLNNADNKKLLSDLAGYIASSSHIDLEFKADYKVVLKVSNEYQKFLQDNEYTTNYLSLNVLKTSYILSDLATFIKGNGYEQGYFVSQEGILIQLKNNPDTSYLFPSLQSGSVDLIEVDVKPESTSSVFRRFAYGEYDKSYYYSFVQDGVTYYRSKYIDISSGEAPNNYLSTAVYSSDLTIIEKSLVNNELVKTNSLNEVRAYLDQYSANLMVIIKLNKADKDLYVTPSVRAHISADKTQYNLINF